MRSSKIPDGWSAPGTRFRGSATTNFVEHLAGFAVFGKLFSAHEECAKTTMNGVFARSTTNVE
jgi:hypothetical protein